ncbi:MAG: hypothetical protein ACJASL_001057 [Paraglaciecola sp.]|jgi:hypothetical protein
MVRVWLQSRHSVNEGCNELKPDYFACIGANFSELDDVHTSSLGTGFSSLTAQPHNRRYKHVHY